MARSRYDIACGREPELLKEPGVVVNSNPNPIPYPRPEGALFQLPFQYGLDSTAAQTIDLIASQERERFLHRHPESERFLETRTPFASAHPHVVVDESDWEDARRICLQIMERPWEQSEAPVGTLFVGGPGSGKTRSLLNSAMTYLISRPNNTAIVVTETDRFNYSGPGRMIFVDWDDLAPYLPQRPPTDQHGQGSHKIYLDNLGLCPSNVWDSIMNMASRRLISLDASVNTTVVVGAGMSIAMFMGLPWHPFYLSQPGFDIAIRR